MALNEKRARDMMKKASGCELTEASFTVVPHGFAALLAGRDELICLTDGPCGFADRLECSRDEYKYGARLRVAPMNEKNSHTLRFFIKWTAPRSVGRNMPSIGLEDVFGGALPVWAEVFADIGVKVVLQSSGGIDRHLADSLGKAAWQVLAAGLKNGYGAEYCCARGESEIMDALLAGYTGIVLDISDKIDQKARLLDERARRERFAALPEGFRTALQASYLGDGDRAAGGLAIGYTKDKLAALALIYGEAIAWLQYIYDAYFKYAPWPVDFMVRADDGLDEAGHYLLANELTRGGVVLAALDLSAGRDAARHGAIAKALGHKVRLSVQNERAELAGWLKNSGCMLDIRPTGQIAALALATLARAGDPLLAELFPQIPVDVLLRQPPGREILTAVAASSRVIAAALGKYKDAYKSALQELAQEQKALWQADIH